MAYGPMGRYLRPNSSLGARDDYELVQISALGRRAGQAGSGDAVLRYGLDAIRGRSRTLAQENAIYRAMVDRVCDVILGGSGLTLQARTGNDRWNRKAEALWRSARRRPEVRHLMNDLQEQRQTLRALFVDGDILKIKVDALRQVQHIESDRLASWGVKAPPGRRLVSGVELDSVDRITGWHVWDYDEHGLAQGKTRRVDVANGIWWALTDRSSQTRGLPIQYSNFAMFDRIADVCDSEAAAWQILSRLAVAITSDYGGVGAEQITPQSGSDVADVAKRVQEYAQALVFHLSQGESIAGIQHNVPGQNFPEALKMFFRMLGLPFGMTLEFTLLIWSDTTYSSGRASKLMIERNVRPYADGLADNLGAEYVWRVLGWMNSGALPLRADAFDHAFICEPYPFLDPKSEALATQLRFACGTTSHTREAAAIGADDEQLVREQQTDIRRRIVAIGELRREFDGDPVAADLARALTLEHFGIAGPKSGGGSGETPPNDGESPDGEPADGVDEQPAEQPSEVQP